MHAHGDRFGYLTNVALFQNILHKVDVQTSLIMSCIMAIAHYIGEQTVIFWLASNGRSRANS